MTVNRKLTVTILSVLAVLSLIIPLTSCSTGKKAAAAPVSSLTSRITSIETAVGQISSYQGNQAADITKIKSDIEFMKQQLDYIRKQVENIAAMQVNP